MNELGWANYANDHEDANGQFEQNFAYADALTSADRLIFFRYMVHMLAHNAGLAATFMPKPFGNLTGSGCTRTPACGTGTERNCSWIRRPPRARPLRARLPLHRRPDRARAGHGRRDLPDRQLLQAIRGRRTEFRRHLGPGLATYGEQPDPDAPRPRRRPGGESGCDGPQPVPGHGGPVGRRPGRHRPDWTRASPTVTTYTWTPGRRPRHPGAAADPAARRRRTGHRRRAREALGKTPDGDYIDYFAQVKRDEFRAWHSGVSDWEVERYLTLF